MVCPKCGVQIDDASTFCPQCGYSVQASQQSKIDWKNWKDYITRQNIEYLIAVSGVLPLVLIILSGVIGIFSGIPLIGFILKLLRVVIAIVFILAELGACAGFGLVLARDRSLLSPPGYVAAGVSVLSLVSVILTAFVKNSGTAAFIIALITLIVGLDVISRVFLQKTELISEISIGRDYGLCLDFVKQLIGQLRQQQAEKKQAAANAAQPYGVPPKNGQPQGYGVPLQNAQPQNVQPYGVQPHGGVPVYPSAAASFFDGKGVELLGYLILHSILSSVTFTIATPWTTCMILQWRKSHTVINGRRLTFTGTGGQLLGLWIKWALLSIITLGIYAFFAYVDYLKWEASHTFFDDEHPAKGAVNPRSAFDGNTFEFIGYSIVVGLLTCVTLGIGYPWAVTMMTSWKMSHFVVSGCRMSFKGSGIELLGTYILCAILVCVTLGIYTPWMIIRINEWTYKNTNSLAPMIPAGNPTPYLNTANLPPTM